MEKEDGELTFQIVEQWKQDHQIPKTPKSTLEYFIGEHSGKKFAIASEAFESAGIDHIFEEEQNLWINRFLFKPKPLHQNAYNYLVDPKCIGGSRDNPPNHPVFNIDDPTLDYINRQMDELVLWVFIFKTCTQLINK